MTNSPSFAPSRLRVNELLAAPLLLPCGRKTRIPRILKKLLPSRKVGGISAIWQTSRGQTCFFDRGYWCLPGEAAFGCGFFGAAVAEVAPSGIRRVSAGGVFDSVKIRRRVLSVGTASVQSSPWIP